MQITPSGSSLPPIRVLVLGPTGAGKSSFIAKMSGHDVPISHGLASCTTNCTEYRFEENGSEIILIDTPGFDDTTRDDMDILGSITRYVFNAQLPGISGVIYLHRITDTRMTGTSRLNLEVFKAICGEDYYPHVVISTTMWNNEKRIEYEYREKQLCEQPNYWREILERQALYQRFDSQASGREMLHHIISAQLTSSPKTRLDVELKEGKHIQETLAARVILGERERREKKRLKELEDETAEQAQRLREEQQQLIQYGTSFPENYSNTRGSFGKSFNKEHQLTRFHGHEEQRSVVTTRGRSEKWDLIALFSKWLKWAQTDSNQSIQERINQ